MRLVVCADDYALTPGVSRGIRELLAAGRISATSVMTVSPYWPEEAAPLAAVAGDADIGLHVTLTDQTSLAAIPDFAPSGRFPSMGTVYKAGLTRRLPLAAIEAEIERQVETFQAHYGRPPAHIDGHHHVHQLPGVRDIVVRVARRIGSGRTWVRNCHEKPGLVYRRGVDTTKALVIGALGNGVRRRASAASVPTNRGFSGAYDFRDQGRHLPTLFARFVACTQDNALVMCHPGYSDSTLATLDVMTHAREAELSFLMSREWQHLLTVNRLSVGPLIRPA